MIPVDMFTVLFAIGRTVGWISHWKEMLDSGDNRIGRPRQLYTGKKPREFTTVETRKHTPTGINWKWIWGGKKPEQEDTTA